MAGMPMIGLPMTVIAFLIVALMAYFAFLKAPKTGSRL